MALFTALRSGVLWLLISLRTNSGQPIITVERLPDLTTTDDNIEVKAPDSGFAIKFAKPMCAHDVGAK